MIKSVICYGFENGLNNAMACQMSGDSELRFHNQYDIFISHELLFKKHNK